MKFCVYAVAFCAAFMTCAAVITPAQAADCKPLTLLATIPMTASDDDRRLYVPVRINGQEKRLLLDTGAATSMLSEAAAKALGLELSEAPVRVYDVTGAATEKLTTTPLKLGRIAFDRVQFMVTSQLDTLDAPDVVGLLGTNLLGKFDVSIDPANKKLDILSQDHCPGNVIYWPAAGYSRIPFDGFSSAHIRINAALDGKPVKAIIDTGADDSTLHSNIATAMFGVTLGAADTPATGHLNERKDLTTYTHVFKALDFDGVAVNNPNIHLIPDMWSEKLTYIPTGSRVGHKSEAAEAEMLIGMNVLRHMRIYIAYKEKAFYFTPASPPPAASK